MKLSRSQIQERIGDKLLSLMATGAMLFLYIPVLVLIVFSFNDNRSLTLPLRGFTLKWYEKFLSNTDMLTAIGNSLYVASVATVITIVIGTVAAFSKAFCVTGSAIPKSDNGSASK